MTIESEEKKTLSRKIKITVIKKMLDNNWLAADTSTVTLFSSV